MAVRKEWEVVVPSVVRVETFEAAASRLCLSRVRLYVSTSPLSTPVRL